MNVSNSDVYHKILGEVYVSETIWNIGGYLSRQVAFRFTENLLKLQIEVEKKDVSPWLLT